MTSEGTLPFSVSHSHSSQAPALLTPVSRGPCVRSGLSKRDLGVCGTFPLCCSGDQSWASWKCTLLPEDNPWSPSMGRLPRAGPVSQGATLGRVAGVNSGAFCFGLRPNPFSSAQGERERGEQNSPQSWHKGGTTRGWSKSAALAGQMPLGHSAQTLVSQWPPP